MAEKQESLLDVIKNIEGLLAKIDIQHLHGAPQKLAELQNNFAALRRNLFELEPEYAMCETSNVSETGHEM